MDKFKKTDSAKLFWIVILGIVLYVILDVIAQVLPPHYSPISQAESDLAVGKFGLIMTVNFLNRGVLSLLFIFAFLQTLDAKRVSRLPFRTARICSGYGQLEHCFLLYSRPMYQPHLYRGTGQFILLLP